MGAANRKQETQQKIKKLGEVERRVPELLESFTPDASSSANEFDHATDAAADQLAATAEAAHAAPPVVVDRQSYAATAASVRVGGIESTQ